MTRFTKTTALAAAAAAVMAIAQPAPAAAQGLPSFCNNTLFLNSVYANIRSDGRTAEVDYHAQFQNRDPQGRVMTATMAALERIGQFQVLRPLGSFTLNAYEQRDHRFLTVHVNHPGGQGAPSAAEVARQLRFTCSFR
jgi:hypothetical protein